MAENNPDLKITRMDFRPTRRGLVVIKFVEGWQNYYEAQPPIRTEPNSNLTLEQALTWCRKNGWIVRDWGTGARAFKGQMYPVRDREAIKFLRRKLDMQVWQTAGHLPGGLQACQIDLAFDL